MILKIIILQIIGSTFLELVLLERGLVRSLLLGCAAGAASAALFLERVDDVDDALGLARLVDYLQFGVLRVSLLLWRHGIGWDGQDHLREHFHWTLGIDDLGLIVQRHLCFDLARMLIEVLYELYNGLRVRLLCLLVSLERWHESVVGSC